MASLLDFTGITKLRDAWPKWKANIIAVNNQVINHVAGTADKHAAENITYDGSFTGKVDMKAAIDRAKEEIDLIVVNASVDPEVALARESSVKVKTFATIDARLEESEQDRVTDKAETTTKFKDIITANVRDFGAKGDGITNDSQSFMDAFESLGIPANGVLLIPKSTGEYYINSLLDFNLGYPTANSNYPSATKSLKIICDGAIKLGSTLPIGIKIYNGKSPDIQLKFIGGGGLGNVASEFSNIIFGEFDVAGHNCASKLVHFLGGTNLNVLASRVKKVYAYKCGMALWHEGSFGFGSIDYIWESACTAGSIINAAGDITIKHWEGDLIADPGMLIQSSGSIHFGKLLVGNMSPTLIQFKACNNVTIDELFLLGNANLIDGVIIDSCFNFVIGHLTTEAMRTGISIRGSQVSILKYTTGSYFGRSPQIDDSIPIVISQSAINPTLANYVDINIHCGTCLSNVVKILSGALGQLEISGEILAFASGVGSGGIGISNASTTFKIISDGLRMETAPNASYSIYSPTAIQNEINGGLILNYAPNGSKTTAAYNTGGTYQNTTGRAKKVYMTATMNSAAGTAVFEAYIGDTATTVLVATHTEVSAANTGAIRTIVLDIPAWWYFKFVVTNAVLSVANIVQI